MASTRPATMSNCRAFRAFSSSSGIKDGRTSLKMRDCSGNLLATRSKHPSTHIAKAGWPCTNLTESRSAGRTTLIRTSGGVAGGRSKAAASALCAVTRVAKAQVFDATHLQTAGTRSVETRLETPFRAAIDAFAMTASKTSDEASCLNAASLSRGPASSRSARAKASTTRFAAHDASARSNSSVACSTTARTAWGPAASTRNRSKMGWMLLRNARASRRAAHASNAGAAGAQSFGCARTQASNEGRTTINNVRSVKHSLYSTSAFCASNIEVKLPKNAAAKEGSLDGSASSSLRAATAGAWKRGQPRNAAASKRDCGCTARERDTASRIREGSCEGSSCCRREHALRCPYRLSHPCKALEPVKTSHSTQPKEKTSHAGAATRSPVFVSSGDVYSSFGSPVSSPPIAPSLAK